MYNIYITLYDFMIGLSSLLYIRIYLFSHFEDLYKCMYVCVYVWYVHMDAY